MTSSSKDPSAVWTCRYWILPIAGMIKIVLTSSNYSVFAMMYLELQEAFQVSNFSLGWLQSVNCLVGFIAGVICPKITERYGYRWVSLFASVIFLLGFTLSGFTPNFYCLYLFYGAMAGMGLFLFDIIQYTIIQENVKVNIVMATSVVTTGYAVSGLLWPIFYKIFLDAYSWRGAFLIMAGIGANCLVIVLFQTSSALGLVVPAGGRKTKQQPESPPSGEEVESNGKGDDQETFDNQKLTLEKIEDSNCDNEKERLQEIENAEDEGNKIKTSVVTRLLKTDMTIWDWTITVAYFLYHCGETFSNFMIGVRMEYINLTKDQIVFTMAASGGIGMVRVLPCYLIDRFELNRTVTAAVLSTILGGATMVSVTFMTFTSIFIFYIFWGLTQAVFYTVLIPVFVDVFGQPRVHKAMGYQTMAYTLATFASMPLCGILLDLFHDVNIPILLFGLFQVVAGLMMFLIKFCRKQAPREA